MQQSRAAQETQVSNYLPTSELRQLTLPLLHLCRAFAPSTPHSYGISSPSVVGSEDDRREKRARRFEAERQAAARASVGGFSSGGGFQGRIAQGGSNPYWNNGGVATPEPENAYDPVSSMSLGARSLG